MFKNNLDTLLWERRMTVRDLAGLSGLSELTLQKIRNNPYEEMKLRTAAKICRALNITPDVLLSWEIEENTTPVAA